MITSSTSGADLIAFPEPSTSGNQSRSQKQNSHAFGVGWSFYLFLKRRQPELARAG
jgi:predicted amidohydrolase